MQVIYPQIVIQLLAPGVWFRPYVQWDINDEDQDSIFFTGDVENVTTKKSIDTVSHSLCLRPCNDVTIDGAMHYGIPQLLRWHVKSKPRMRHKMTRSYSEAGKTERKEFKVGSRIGSMLTGCNNEAEKCASGKNMNMWRSQRDGGAVW